jgi:exodeoxyribonuclease VII small subunit
MPTKSLKSVNFEAKIQELAAIVEKIESGELTLEEAMQQFEKGVKLTQECHTVLQNAEQKVKILVEQAGNYRLEEFALEDDENDYEDDEDEEDNV